MSCHHRGVRLVTALVLGAFALASSPVRAFDPATTHAGLTERAVLASRLHQVLSRRLGRPLGLLEPLQIHSRYLELGVRRSLWARLGALDPAGGYRPSADGAATAMSWIVAGSVLAKTPPERGRNHFFDPRTGKGLDDGSAVAGVAHEIRLALDDGTTVREMATGTAFDLSGHSSLQWIASPVNDEGLPAMLDHWERSVTAADPAERESALVRALLALGGIAAVLEDAGEPAHVRNDFRAAFLQAQSSSSWDRASSFERFVANRYGRGGIPAASAAVRRPTLESYFTGSDGQGLADRTQRRFFSEGTLPTDVVIDPATTTHDVVRNASESLAYPEPVVTGLSLKELGEPHYMMVEGRRALAYVRVPGRVRFALDERVYVDSARALLPEVGAYTAGLLDHLVRAALAMSVSGRRLTVSLEGVDGVPTDERLRLFGEDARGTRTELPGLASGSALGGGKSVTVDVPAGIKKVAAVLRAREGNEPFIAIGEAAVP